MIEEILDNKYFNRLLKENNDIIIFFYSDISEKSKKALEILNLIKKENPKIPLFRINVSMVKEIHSKFGINMVPAIAIFKEGKLLNIIYGLYDKHYYEILLNNNIYHEEVTSASNKLENETKKQKKVVVYTSPTCSWCSALKSYFRKNNIKFTEIDVTKNERAGQEIMRKSGQMGVPQTEIDGRIIVGFDKAKIDAILGIKSK
ncbi:MAG: thioredoxin domain-containing protein [Actinobacteria bacterium]|nr:thioredoxin domain-containing protein [Cyanobacteriota bacterium]MCL5772460.1 thioredoxin domain-containing protein [Actinomycetota bacterium]